MCLSNQECDTGFSRCHQESGICSCLPYYAPVNNTCLQCKFLFMWLVVIYFLCLFKILLPFNFLITKILINYLIIENIISVSNILITLMEL